MLQFPENKIMTFLNGMIDHIEDDYNNKVMLGNEKSTYLFNLFHNENGERDIIGNIDYYLEAVEIFTGRKDRQNRPIVNRFFNNTQNRLPIYVVDMPSEASSPFIESNYSTFIPYYSESEYREQNSRRFNSTYTVWCIGNSEIQVQIMYHILRGFLVGNPQIIEAMGFQNFTFRGTDVLRDELREPAHLILKRGLGWFFYYEESAPSVASFKFPKTVKFKPNIL